MTEIKRAFRWEFRNVFDTFLSCRMLGQEGCSLAALVEGYAGVRLEKKEQKSNWKKRPLTRSQLDYAHLDTAYLEGIQAKMQSELVESGLWEEIREDFERVVHEEPGEERSWNEDAWLSVPGARKLSPARRGRLKNVYELRENLARQRNITPFRLISNRTLLSLVCDVPKTKEELSSSSGVHPVFVKKHGDRLLHALSTARDIPNRELPPVDVMEPDTLDLYRRLKQWRQRIADYRELDSSLILNNRSLRKIAEFRPGSLEDLEGLDLLTNMRFRMYGEQILQVLQGSYTGRMPSNLPVKTRSRVG